MSQPKGTQLEWQPEVMIYTHPATNKHGTAKAIPEFCGAGDIMNRETDIHARARGERGTENGEQGKLAHAGGPCPIS